SCSASFPIVVVLPVPFTPTTSTTLGCSLTPNVGGSPNSAPISSDNAALRSPNSPRASNRLTSSAVARTPTSARMSASSNRSHASSSPGSNAADASSCVSARRDFDSESRRRANIPPRCSSGSGPASSSPRSCAQLRGNGGLLLAREPPRDDLRHAVGAHGDAVQDVRRFHRSFLVRDHDELRSVGVTPEQLDEASDVRVVERRLDLVEEVERARPREEQREEERDRAESLLAPGEQRHPRNL